MIEPREMYRRMAEAVHLDRAGTFRWFGVPAPSLDERLLASIGLDAFRAHLVRMVETQLYSRCYTQGEPMARERPPSAALSSGGSVLGEYMRAWGSATVDTEGWRVRGRGSRGFLLQKDALTIEAPAEACLSRDELRPGASIRLREPAWRTALAPGYFLVSGGQGFPESAAHCVRVYLHATPTGAVAFMAALRDLAAQDRFPFKCKALCEESLFSRCDAVVWYLHARDLERALDALEDLLPAFAGEVRDPVPALTRRLAPGIGLADDPGPTTSFGAHRMHLVSEAIVGGWPASTLSDTELVVRDIESRFKAEGLDPDRPHLRPGGAELPRDLRSNVSSPRPAPLGPDLDPIHVASGIADQLVASAHWSNGLCTWIGARTAVENRDRLGGDAVGATVGPDLYSGNAGIAWILAETDAACPAPRLRDTAVAAIRHALRYSHLAPSRNGLYTGPLGIAWAAVRIAEILDLASLRREASELALSSAQATRGTGWDLVAGTAGDVVALTSLYRRLGDGRLLELAVGSAELLLRRARVTREGWSWPRRSSGPRLTGLSHGASGAAYAFAVLAMVRQEDAFREAALGAIRYERSLFSPRHENWADVRSRALMKGAQHTFATMQWCHGAPGVLVARLTCAAAFGSGDLKDEIALASASTLRATRSMMTVLDADFSLCHGLTGNAEIVAMATPPIAQDDGLKTAHDAVRLGAGRYFRRGNWPCGTGRGWAPGLMMGTSGIAWYYLRRGSAVTEHPLAIGASDVFPGRDVTIRATLSPSPRRALRPSTGG